MLSELEVLKAFWHKSHTCGRSPCVNEEAEKEDSVSFDFNQICLVLKVFNFKTKKQIKLYRYASLGDAAAKTAGQSFYRKYHRAALKRNANCRSCCGGS